MTAAKKVICTAAAPVFITSHRVGSAPGTNRTGRRLLSLALWAFVLHTPTLAQLDSALSLFPLEVGNVWQYHEFYRNLCEPEPFSQYFFVRVTGDSLMPDERRYRHLEGMSALYRGLSYSDLYWMDSATASFLTTPTFRACSRWAISVCMNRAIRSISVPVLFC